MKLPRLGVNIDHIATLRQLRSTPYPNLLEAARIAEDAGAAQITVHLREDRRHIQDQDVVDLKQMLNIPLNLEVSLDESRIKFALKIKPQWTCLVPEKRQEVTTEGGLDVKKFRKKMGEVIRRLHAKKIKVSAFIEPSIEQVEISHTLGCDAVEFHTGSYANQTHSKNPKPATIKKELQRIQKACLRAAELGIGVHVGHGLDYQNIRPLTEWEWDQMTRDPLIQEYNIGHSIVCRAAIVGLDQAIREMKAAIEAP